jgi:hypothetical protein
MRPCHKKNGRELQMVGTRVRGQEGYDDDDDANRQQEGTRRKPRV